MKTKKYIQNSVLSLGIFLTAGVLSIPLQSLGVEEHITTIFIFAVFLISLLTDGFAYGIISSISGVLAINYAFTYPYFALDFLDTVNLISAVIMMPYSAIIKTIWGYPDEGSVKKLQVNIANIRKKFGVKPGEAKYITNELGVGYRMNGENNK